MMDHILELDWCATSGDTRPYLVSKKALDNCCIEKIIRNEFVDPLISSDEEENEPNNIDWDVVFKTSNPQDKLHHGHIPGLRSVAPYPKISALNGIQHFQCLKVLCRQNQHVLPEHFFRRPICADYHILESLTELYEKEQKEFIEWAKTLWPTSHCSRVLKVDPIVETTYEQEFKLRGKRLTGFPKSYNMAAQIPLECDRKLQYNATKLKNLIFINVSDLPIAKIPKQLSEYTSIMEQCAIPKPCYKHPYQFVLPNDDSLSMLPMTEIHRELSQFAAENGAKVVTSESALKCLLALNRFWTIPITVCPAITVEGTACNVVALDSEISVHKEPSMMRSYKAYRRLLQHAFIPLVEYEKIPQKSNKDEKTSKNNVASATKAVIDDDADLSSDDDAPLVILTHETDDNTSDMKESNGSKSPDKQKDNELQNDGQVDEMDEEVHKDSEDVSLSKIIDTIGVYSCTCSESSITRAAPRSYTKWRFMDSGLADSIDVIIHCSHKAATDKSKELIMEPILEYQLELGASEQLLDNLRSNTLELMLREDATLLTVRLDGTNGEVVRLDTATAKELKEKNDKSQQVLNIVHTTLNGLQGLLPGHYLLQHEPSHGANAMLYVSSAGGPYKLDLDIDKLVEPDEAKVIQAPPTITTVMLPFHKFRKILPCAFTPFEYQVAKSTKKPPPKIQKPPPGKWPKKKNRKRGKK